MGRTGVMSPRYTIFRTHEINTVYLEYYFKTTSWHRFMKLNGDSGARFDRFTIAALKFMEMPITYPDVEEQLKRLIDQLCYDESQWTYRLYIRTEDQLWENFKYILEIGLCRNWRR